MNTTHFFLDGDDEDNTSTPQDDSLDLVEAGDYSKDDDIGGMIDKDNSDELAL